MMRACSWPFSCFHGGMSGIDTLEFRSRLDERITVSKAGGSVRQRWVESCLPSSLKLSRANLCCGIALEYIAGEAMNYASSYRPLSTISADARRIQ